MTTHDWNDLSPDQRGAFYLEGDYPGTLLEAREYVTANEAKGVRCPCCTRNVEVRTERLTRRDGVALFAMLREFGTDYGHIPSLPVETRGLAHTRYWHMIEPLIQPGKGNRPPTQKAGYWRLTPEALEFLRGETEVWTDLEVYLNQPMHFFMTETMTIWDVMEERFDFEEFLSRSYDDILAETDRLKREGARRSRRTTNRTTG